MSNVAVCVRQTKTVVMRESQVEVQDESAAYFQEVEEAKQRQADVEARRAAVDVDTGWARVCEGWQQRSWGLPSVIKIMSDCVSFASPN